MLEVEKYKSGIKIKKSNRGKFTSYCGGEVTSACILKGKNSSDPAVRKRATFAANARKWKHQHGGPFSAENPMPQDNTRVLDANGWNASLRAQHMVEMERTRARRRNLMPRQASFSPISSSELQRRENQRKQAQFYRDTYHMWQVDPTRPYPKTDLEMIGAFNYAGTQGAPIRTGLATAIGAGAVRLLPKAGRFIYNGAKNEAGMFAKSVTTAQGRQMWGLAASNFGKAVVDPKQWTIGKSWVGNTAFQLGKAELYGNVSGGLYLGLQGKPLDGSMTPEEQRRADAVASDSVNAWFEDLDPNAQYIIE